VTADRNRAAARRISFQLFAAGQLALLDELTTAIPLV
jgi:hypothetical protein